MAVHCIYIVKAGIIQSKDEWEIFNQLVLYYGVLSWSIAYDRACSFLLYKLPIDILDKSVYNTTMFL